MPNSEQFNDQGRPIRQDTIGQRYGREPEQVWEEEEEEIPNPDYQNMGLLPADRRLKALIIGASAGILSGGLGLFLNILGHQRTIGASGTDLAYNLAGYSFLSFLAGLLLYFLAGFLTGKLVVERRQGFLAGLIGGGVTYLISFFSAYLPGIPGHIGPSASFNPLAAGGGVVFAILLLLINAVIGGLLGVFGARLATGRYSFYQPYIQASR